VYPAGYTDLSKSKNFVYPGTRGFENFYFFSSEGNLISS
jgi:hypothetical protein